MEKAFEISMEMLQQRGYQILEHDEERILAEKPDKNKICVFLCDTSKLNVECIQEIMSMMYKMEINHSILVFNDSPTPVARKMIEENQEIKIEVFHIKELQYNITKHNLVPKHELAYKKGTDEYKIFKIRYMADKFPILLSSDPVVRFYNFEKGDIIRIYRKNGIIMYRIVK